MSKSEIQSSTGVVGGIARVLVFLLSFIIGFVTNILF
jgi:hypothetical protein